MGICASSPITRNSGTNNDWPRTAKIIHIVDGKLQELKQPIKTGHILSKNPNSFLCSSESMYVDCQVPHMPDDEELQLGQLYFLMPLSHFHAPLSLQDLCDLAIKASSALAQYSHTKKTAPSFYRNDLKFPATTAGTQRCYQIPIIFDSARIKSQVDRGSKRIEL